MQTIKGDEDSRICQLCFHATKHGYSDRQIDTHTYELHQAKRGLMVIKKNFVRYISAFDYYEGIYWFCANTFENKIVQYFTEKSESHVGYFQLWRHILCHLRHLLALCWKSHKPPFRLAQLIHVYTIMAVSTGDEDSRIRPFGSHARHVTGAWLHTQTDRQTDIPW